MVFQIVNNLTITGTSPYDPSNSSNMSYYSIDDNDYYVFVGVVNSTDQSITVTVGGADYISGTAPTQFGNLPLSNNPATIDASSTGAISFNISEAYTPTVYVSVQLVGTVVPSGSVNAYISSKPYAIKELR
jgi:hypothetical protein